jgi:DNA-binding NtrC family response regulator
MSLTASNPRRDRILVVGRNPDIMARVRALLEPAGFSVLAAFTDDDAAELIATSGPDALLIGGGVEPGSRSALVAAFERTWPGRPGIEHFGGPHRLLEHVRAALEKDVG